MSDDWCLFFVMRFFLFFCAPHALFLRPVRAATNVMGWEFTYYMGKNQESANSMSSLSQDVLRISGVSRRTRTPSLTAAPPWKAFFLLPLPPSNTWGDLTLLMPNAAYNS